MQEQFLKPCFRFIKGIPAAVLMLVFITHPVVMAADITLDPAPGDYRNSILVSFKDLGDCNIYYTLDGSEPSSSSSVYRAGIPIDDDTVVRYFCLDSSGQSRPVQEAFYRIGKTVAVEGELLTVATPPGGVYEKRVMVVLNSRAGATVFYTMDGSDPGTDSPVFTSPLRLTVDTTLRFFSVGVNGDREPLREETYTFRLVSKLIDTTPPEVGIIPEPAAYRTGDLLRLKSNEETDIYYTLDGSDPTENSILYEGPFFVGDTGLVRFFALDTSGNRSGVYEAEFSMDTEPPSSEAYPVTGLYTPPVEVRIRVSDSSARVFYTLDESEPTENSNVYREPIVLVSDTMLKYYAMDKFGNREPTRQEDYLFDDEPPVTVADPPGGEYIPPFTVRLSTEGVARIYYSDDGYTPDEDSPLYITPFTFLKPVTLKFFALDRAGNMERMQTHEYTLVNGVWRKYARGVFLLPSVTDGRTIWMGSELGLTHYNLSSGRRNFFSEDDGLLGQEVRDLVLDEEGTLWIATEQGLNAYTANRGFIHFTRDEGLPDRGVSGIGVDVDNSIWVGTRSGVSHIVNERVVETIGKKDGLPDNNVSCVVVDYKGNKWFGTRRGVAKYTGMEWNIFDRDNGLIDDDIKSITVDSAWNIWAGTPRGVTMYDGVKWTNYTVDDGLPGNKVMLVAADPDGEVWVTTTAGVARFVNGKWVKEK